MSIWTEINWAEGMFLRPHHLQMLHRYGETISTAALNTVSAYNWGFSELEISTEAVANSTFAVDRCTLRLPSGTWLRVPENTQVEPRDFDKILQNTSGALDVYFGVAVLQRVRPNTIGAGVKPDGRAYRYTSEHVEFYDENTGQNPQQIEVRRFSGAIFFGDEDRAGYETVRVASIERSAGAGGAPQLVETAVPPVLDTQVWAGLYRQIKNILAEIGAKGSALARTAQERRMSFSTGALADVEHLFKLHVLNESGELIAGLLSSPTVHPYQAYVYLRGLLGKLSLFHDSRRPQEVQAYNHDDCGPGMFQLIKYIQDLLHAIAPSDFEFAVFVRQPLGLSVELTAEWIHEERSMFIGFDTDMDVDQLREYIGKVDMKMASPSLAPELHTRGLPGLSFKDAQVRPGELPHPPGRYYFQIRRDNEYWPRVIQEKAVALRVREQTDLDSLAQMNLTLYIVKPHR